MQHSVKQPEHDFYVDPTITISTKHGAYSWRLPLLLLIAGIGSICTLMVCISMVQPTYRALPFWSVSVLATVLTCFLSLLPYRMHWLGYLPLLVGCIVSLFQRETLVLGAKYFYNAYYSAIHHTDTQFFQLDTPQLEETAVTWFLCCSAGILCCLISRVLMRKPNFLLYFALTFVPIEFGLYQGLEMNLPAMMLVVITWFGILALQFAERRLRSKNTHSVRYSNATHCGITAIALSTAAVLVSALLTSQLHLTTDEQIQEKRSALRHDIENFQWEDVTGSLSQLAITLGLMQDPEVRELGVKSQLEYTEKDCVEVTFQELPDHGIYLKNYTASLYEDNEWSSISEEDWKENTSLYTLFHQYACVPQIQPFLCNQEIYGENNTTVEIVPLTNTDLILQPYAAYSEECSYQNDADCQVVDKDDYSFTISKSQNYYNIAHMGLTEYYLPASGFNFNNPATSQFFDLIGADSTQDMFTITMLNSPYLENSDYMTASLQTALAENYAYRDFVYETYTDLPESEALSAVYDALPEEIFTAAETGSDWEILRAIRTYLADQCTYTLSPGVTPSTRDFVNYFLLENQAGYCVHYATAGTILARYFGIPARYCEGYIVSLDMMEEGTENADGSVTVTLPDSASHAWCEFYIDGYGWIPYELTPGYYGADDDVLSNVTESEVEGTEDEAEEEEEQESEDAAATTQVTTTTQTVTTTTVSSGDASSQGQQTTPSAASGSGSNRIFRVLMWIGILLLCALLLAALLILLRNYRLNRRKRQFRDENTIAAIQCIYTYLMQLLALLSLTPENQQMLDFAEKAAEQLGANHYDGAGTREIIHLALAADMGEKPPAKEEIRAAIHYVQGLAQKISENQKPVSRWIMKYIRHLI